MLRNERILRGSPGRLSGRGKGKGVSGGLGSEDEKKKKKKTYVQIDPQQDSETYCRYISCEKRDGKKKERKKEKKEGKTDILHRFCKRITRCCQGFVDIFFACDLIAHFDSFIVENLVGFLDLFGSVVCWHFFFIFLSLSFFLLLLLF